MTPQCIILTVHLSLGLRRTALLPMKNEEALARAQMEAQGRV
jgi:hypothetical protein